MATKKTQDSEVSILEVNRGVIDICLLGESPMICNAMSQKVAMELLLPRPKKNAAEKASTLKHNPMEEFRRTIYRARNPKSPTLIVQKSTSFKNALMGAAIDIPGAAKSQIGRLTYVMGDEVPIFGVPQLFMSVTRSADMNRTPDVRTRAIIPHWACKISINYTRPLLKEPAIVHLLAAAGMTQGIGDWRTQKGSGNYGSFRICNEDDPEFLKIIKEGGKAAQESAMATPACYDSETEELLSWFESEVKRRGFDFDTGRNESVIAEKAAKTRGKKQPAAVDYDMH
jgi:hypothetical protein